MLWDFTCCHTTAGWAPRIRSASSTTAPLNPLEGLTEAHSSSRGSMLFSPRCATPGASRSRLANGQTRRNRRHRRREKVAGERREFQSESHGLYWHNGRLRPTQRTHCLRGGGSAGSRIAWRDNPGGTLWAGLQRQHQGAVTPRTEGGRCPRTEGGVRSEVQNAPWGAAPTSNQQRTSG